MKKDVNLKLLGLLLVVILGFTAYLSFSQMKMGWLSKDLEDTNKSLSAVTAQAIALDTQANQINASKEQIQKDRENLESKYNQLSQEVEQLKKDKETLAESLGVAKSGLETTKASLAQREQAYTILFQRFKEVETALENTNDQVASLFAKLNKACSKLSEENQKDCK